MKSEYPDSINLGIPASLVAGELQMIGVREKCGIVATQCLVQNPQDLSFGTAALTGDADEKSDKGEASTDNNDKLPEKRSWKLSESLISHSWHYTRPFAPYDSGAQEYPPGC
jgi:hypothetical protein